MSILGVGIIGAASYASSRFCAIAFDFKLAALKKKYALLIRGVHTDVHTVQKIAIVAIALFSGIATASLCPVAFSLIAKVGVGCIGGLVLGVIPAALAANPAFKVTEEEREAWLTRFVPNASTEELAELQGLPWVTGNLAHVKRILDERVPIGGYYIFYQSVSNALRTGEQKENVEVAFFESVVKQGTNELTNFVNQLFADQRLYKLNYIASILRAIDTHGKTLEIRSKMFTFLVSCLAPKEIPAGHPCIFVREEFLIAARDAGKIVRTEDDTLDNY